MLGQMREIYSTPTVISDADYKVFKGECEEHIEMLKKNKVDYSSLINHISKWVTKTAGQTSECCFSASQLKELFSLAK